LPASGKPFAGFGKPFGEFGKPFAEIRKRIDRQPSRRDAWFLLLASEADDIP
jgi:hypothetical protein